MEISKKIVFIFSILGISVLGIMGLDNLLSNNASVGVTELIMSLLLLANLLNYVFFQKSIRTSSSVIVFILLVSLIFMYINGGIGGKTGILWFATFPIVATFLMGDLLGSVGTLFLMAICGVLLHFGFTVFNFIETRQLFASMITILLLIRFYWKHNQEIESEMEHKSQQLNNYLDLIAQESKDGQNKTRVSEKTKMAMINLLEDSRELELKIKEERDKVSSIIKSMGEGLFVLDENHKVDLINPVAEKLLDLTSGEAVGKDWSMLVQTYNGDRPIPTEERSTISALKEGKVILTDLEDNHYYLTKSGRRFPVTSTTTPITKDGKVIGAIKVFRDATKDKVSKEHIESEVINRTAQLSASINSLTLGFIMTNKEGVVSLINMAAKNILKIQSSLGSLSDLNKLLTINPTLVDLVDKSHKESKLIEINDVVFTNKVLHLYISPISTNKQEGPVDIGTVILFEDVTEEKIIQRSRDEFFSIASHELRTPLTAIRGNTALIQDMYKDKLKDKELAEMVEDIHSSSIRLINIVNDFLNVSRLEMGRMEFKKEKVDIVKLTSDIVGELNQMAKEKGLSINVDLPKKSTLTVLADSERLKQVIINLISNGIKYTDKGSINISFEDKGKLAKFIISDTGRGIASANQNLLFHKFQQAGSSLFTRDTTKGTGLGLYISKLMVNGMGGEIALVDSVIDKGSVFMFTLPK